MASEHYQYNALPSMEDEDGNEVKLQTNPRSKPFYSTWRPIPYVIFHLILLLLYIAGTYALLRRMEVSVKLEGNGRPLLVYSPAQSAIKYEKYVFNALPNLTSPYVGESRPSLDKAWHDLVQYTNMRISEDDLRALNRTSIPLGKGGGFYGEMAVFHELHCVKFIRQAFHLEYYSNSFGKIEKETMGEHFEHCIEILRQSVICRGDTTLITFHWGRTVKLPQPDFTSEHECVNWDSLMGWASEHAIDVFEDGMLVHPTLGPSYPGGFRDDRPLPPASDAVR